MSKRNLSSYSSTSNHNESNNETKINIREKSSSRGEATDRFMEEIDHVEDKKIMEETFQKLQNFKDSFLIKAKSLIDLPKPFNPVILKNKGRKESELNYEESLKSRTDNLPL